jgi:cobalamin biosynthesis Mg chelatase CobN
MQSDEQLYELSAKELAESPRQGLLIKCMAKSEGNENKGKALYIETRVEEMKQEIREGLKKENAAQKQAQATQKQAQATQKQAHKEAQKQSQEAQKQARANAKADQKIKKWQKKDSSMPFTPTEILMWIFAIWILIMVGCPKQFF